MPLNPVLYSALQRLFGAVKISKEGQTPIVQKVLGKKVVIDGGEEYCVCCPFCGDTRFRLYINHRYYHPHMPDKILKAYSHMIHCFNEDCLAIPENKTELRKRIVLACNNVPVAPLAPAPPRSKISPRPMKLNPHRIPIHFAAKRVDKLREMLERRRIDIESLDQWEAYIIADPESIWFGRIVVPVREIKEDGTPGEVIGKQVRVIDGVEDQDPLKYRTLGSPSFSFYNFADAVKEPFIVLVEGFLDAWRVGKMCCPLLGSSLSLHQAELLRKYASGKPVFILLDGDAVDKARKVQQRLTQYGIGSRLVVLSDGKDPCDVSDEELTEAFKQALRGGENEQNHREAERNLQPGYRPGIGRVRTRSTLAVSGSGHH